MGLVSKAEVISWADGIIATHADPPEWLIDVSLASNGNDEMVETSLRDLPCDGNRRLAAHAALGRFAAAFNAGKIAPKSAARILEAWADHANINDDDRTKGKRPSRIADLIAERLMSEQDVVSEIKTCLEHFAAAIEVV